MKCVFSNDDNVEIKLPVNNNKSSEFMKRNEHEVLFRQINTFLMKNKIITNNIIDLGAWIGDNSIPWAKNFTPSIVYAIDPSPNNCEFINNVAILNSITNIKTIQKAISDKTQYVATNDTLDHCSFVYNVDGLNGRIKLLSHSLDELYKNGEIDCIGYIHLDVEGMEEKVIKGAENLINEFDPIITFEQHLHTDNYMGLSQHLKQKNYVVYLIDEVLPLCRPDCRNFIAFPSKIKNIPEVVKDIEKYVKINNLFIII